MRMKFLVAFLVALAFTGTMAAASMADQPSGAPPTAEESEGLTVRRVPASGDGVQAYTCPPNHFCVYDGLNGGGGGFELSGCGFVRLGPDFGWWDKASSISNNTGSKQNALLFNWAGEPGIPAYWWDLVWESIPGNWGNLPASANNVVDGVRLECG